jgi:hypothetical protein
MSGVLFPIGPNAEAALAARVGRAGLRSAAGALAGGPVTFVRELSGPAFETREAALAAYRGRIDDDGVAVAPADRFCDLQAVLAPGETPRRIVWRLSLGYWRIDGAPAPAMQGRQARRKKDSRGMDGGALTAIARQPLRPVQPQKALDIGLFEVRLPENPALIIADE